MGHQLDGTVGGNHLPPVQELSLQKTADQGGVAHLEQNVLGAQGEGGILVGIGDDFLHFLQSGGGDHEVQLPLGTLLRMEGPTGQTEAVHSHGGDGVVGHFKFDAGVNGTALILGHGKNGAGDQLL